MPERKTLDAAEFQDAGYLAEVNRAVLHPLGLAMAVTVELDGTVTLGPIYDDRDDPEGVYFGSEGPPEYLEALRSRLANVARLWAEREPERQAALGFMVQPPPP